MTATMDGQPPDTRETPPATDDRLRVIGDAIYELAQRWRGLPPCQGKTCRADCVELSGGVLGNIDALVCLAREQQAVGAVAALTAASRKASEWVGAGATAYYAEGLARAVDDELATHAATLESLRRSG